MNKGVLYGIGVGPGDPELVTMKAVRTVIQSQVIAAPRTADGNMLAFDAINRAMDIRDREVLPLDFAMSRDKAVMQASHQKAAADIMQRLDEGKNVSMLNIGDVSIYSTFNYMKDIIAPLGYEVVMVPGVPSFCAVAAALGANLTPGMTTPLHIIPAGFTDLPAALDYPGTKVVMKAGKALPEVKELLRDKGMYEQASLVQDCGLPTERIAHSLDEAEAGSYFTTMIVRP